MSLDLVFCGTPRFAVPTLEKLVGAGFRVHLVVTQPDRPKGRGLELVQSPVKESALKLGLPITQPDRIKTNDEFRAQLTTLKPDAIIVVGYGRIIPQWMLDLPPFGNLNVHASLLPKYRGAAPIQWAIANGETVTGVTTMRIDAGLDTGDILQQQELSITPDDTAETLAPRLASIGADLTVETPRRLLPECLRDLQPHPWLPTLARSPHKIPRQNSAAHKSSPRNRRRASSRTTDRRRPSAGRLRPLHIPRSAGTPTGRKEAHPRPRFPPRLSPPTRRKAWSHVI
jgi:methionyl-tRNA formyltransferase